MPNAKMGIPQTQPGAAADEQLALAISQIPGIWYLAIGIWREPKRRPKVRESPGAQKFKPAATSTGGFFVFCPFVYALSCFGRG